VNDKRISYEEKKSKLKKFSVFKLDEDKRIHIAFVWGENIAQAQEIAMNWFSGQQLWEIVIEPSNKKKKMF
jgi:sulfate adenylyltransferase subunit 1 (EFTu-like GTPase family)